MSLASVGIVVNMMETLTLTSHQLPLNRKHHHVIQCTVSTVAPVQCFRPLKVNLSKFTASAQKGLKVSTKLFW